MAPAATTAPVVSMVPPIQAPATAGDIPTHLAMRGSRISMGMAHSRTREMVWLTFLESPLTAPPAAMAAETPQMDTAVAENGSQIHRRAHFTGDPDTEVEDDPDDQNGLDHSIGAHLGDGAEEDLGAQEDQTDLDEELRLDGSFQPIGHAENVADQQTEDQSPEDDLQAVVR